MSCDAPNGYCDGYEISSFFQQPSLNHRKHCNNTEIGMSIYLMDELYN